MGDSELLERATEGGRMLTKLFHRVDNLEREAEALRAQVDRLERKSTNVAECSQ